MEARLTKPEGANPYYIRKPSGYSPCDYGNNSKGQQDPILNVLPNCVGWATGRWWEIQGCGIKYGFTTIVDGKRNGNACYFIKAAQDKGLEISDKPTLGGIMVWSGGNSGAGHVAVVERITESAVITSESEWNGRVFTTYRRSGASYTDGCAWMRSKYKYLGCIVNPAVKEEETEMVKDIKVRVEDTGEVVTVKGIYKEGKNYVALSDLGDNKFAKVGWDGEFPTLAKIKECHCVVIDK